MLVSPFKKMFTELCIETRQAVHRALSLTIAPALVTVNLFLHSGLVLLPRLGSSEPLHQSLQQPGVQTCTSTRGIPF